MFPLLLLRAHPGPSATRRAKPPAPSLRRPVGPEPQVVHTTLAGGSPVSLTPGRTLRFTPRCRGLRDTHAADPRSNSRSVHPPGSRYAATRLAPSRPPLRRGPGPTHVPPSSGHAARLAPSRPPIRGGPPLRSSRPPRPRNVATLAPALPVPGLRSLVAGRSGSSRVGSRAHPWPPLPFRRPAPHPPLAASPLPAASHPPLAARPVVPASRPPLAAPPAEGFRLRHGQYRPDRFSSRQRNDFPKRNSRRIPKAPRRLDFFAQQNSRGPARAAARREMVRSC
ncbi:hypothetical protein SAMN05216258_108185 [Albimonas pacifica]|uniref:Uncharacterized protein n=1 Tax=Albimonas pacifica TaxID=1114924 RepID=A0A1I3JWC7_9RHOB|nr:hypothetical protein SAMN05216258_108185 [Albimonas pacifica]